MPHFLSIMLMALLCNGMANARNVREEKQPQWVKDYHIVNPFLSCGPKDNCVELPDIPPVWRFIPEYMGYRKFTPVGAIRKDWNDYWRSKTRFWWDYTYNLPDWRWNYNGWNLFNNSYNQW